MESLFSCRHRSRETLAGNSHESADTCRTLSCHLVCDSYIRGRRLDAARRKSYSETDPTSGRGVWVLDCEQTGPAPNLGLTKRTMVNSRAPRPWHPVSGGKPPLEEVVRCLQPKQSPFYFRSRLPQPSSSAPLRLGRPKIQNSPRVHRRQGRKRSLGQPRARSAGSLQTWGQTGTTPVSSRWQIT